MGLMESLGPTAFNILIKVGFGVMAVVILTALFFGSKYFSAWYKKRKQFKITAAIYNPDGSFYTQKMGKFKTGDGVDKMLFMNSKETMPVIDPKYIRNLTVTLWRYGVGQYAVIPPKVWESLEPKKFKIDVINMQMKNFAYLEQRAAVSRWSGIKSALQQWAPFITIIIICITAGVAIWFMMKGGLEMYNSVVSARMSDCARLLGQNVLPTG